MASSIVKSAAQQLGNLLVDEAKSLYKVRDKIESLQAELEWVECFLRDADTQQHQDRIICKWVSQVRDFAYDGEDIIEKYLHGVSHHRGDGIRNTLKWFSCILFTCDAWTLHNLGYEIDNLTFRMSELTSRLRKYGIQVIRPTKSLEYNTMIREERRTHSHTEEDVFGLEKDIRKMVDQLLNEDVNVVGISGIGGLGKTTLARKVFKHKDIKDHFNDSCVWVYVSKEFEKGSIFQEILFGLDKGEGKNIKELPIEALLTKIHELLRKQKCLVVLDDIWTVKAWESLKPAFESIKGSPSKIFLTTRTQGLIQNIGTFGYLHLLQRLSFEDSWKLFKHKAFLRHQSITGVDLSSSRQNEPQDEFDQMEKLGKEMLKHCDGLPIAIVAVGGILSTKKTVSEWEDVRTNISSYLMGMEQEGTSSGILGILELSYNELPFYLKPCFLYLGNFPEDCEISSHKLYHLWQAEGFLAIEGDAKKKGGTTYDIGERYLSELVQRSMVQVGECWTGGRIKTCRVHDVMRDMCLRKCEEVSFLSHIECTESGTTSVLPPFSAEIKKSRRCALHGEDQFRQGFQLREKAIGLRSLLVFNERCTPGRKIWKSIPLLRVLGLQRPGELYGLKHLIHLRYLSVSGSHFVDIPCLFDLPYLETLDLRCLEVKLRNNKFCKMKRLRHLYLAKIIRVKGDKKLMFPTGGQMETIKNFDPERCETKDLMQMTSLRVFSIRKDYTFEKAEDLKWVLEAPVMKKAGQMINTFRIGIHEDMINEDPLILSSAARHPSFKGLRIKGPGRSSKNKEGNKCILFPESLSQVELTECETIGEGGFLLGLGKLVSLQELFVYGSFSGGGGGCQKICLSPNSFPQLTRVCIVSRKDLFELEVGEGAVANLQSLELSECENLDKLNNLPNNLTQVEISHCGIKEGRFSALEKLPHLKSFKLLGNVGNKMSFSPGSFPQLTQLCMKYQDELEEWEVGEGALANLSSLKLERWRKLNKVTINKLPDSLTQVELQDCESIGVVSLLECLGNHPRLQLLRLNQCIPEEAKMNFSPGSFPQLTQLSLRCTYLEELEFGDGALPCLQRLDLKILYRFRKWNRLPDSLTEVNLVSCKIWDEGGAHSLLAFLEKLPRLRLLGLTEVGVVVKQGDKMRFSAGSFPQLTLLHLSLSLGYGMQEEWEWEVGDEALPNLQRLELYNCKNLKKLPQGLPHSVHIECRDPCIKGIENYNTCPHAPLTTDR